jgi:hypothetical protein
LTEVPVYKAVPYLATFKRYFRGKVDREQRKLVGADQLQEERKHGGGEGDHAAYSSQKSQRSATLGKNKGKELFATIIGGADGRASLKKQDNEAA